LNSNNAPIRGMDQFDSEPRTGAFTDTNLGSKSLRVVEIRLDDPRLGSFISENPSATVYHQQSWLQSLTAEYDQKLVLLACENVDGRLFGVFPLLRTRGFPIPVGGILAKARLASLPRTPVAGPLASSPEVLRLLLTSAIRRASDHPALLLQIKTEGPLLDGLIDGYSGTAWRKSYVLSLPEDPAQLRIDKGIRKKVNKAQRLGLQVRMTSSEEDMHKWYSLYLRTMRRVVVPPRPLRLFLAMQKYMEPLGLMKTMMVEQHLEGKTRLIAGQVFLIYGKRVSCAFPASPAENFSLQPNELIHWEGIQWAMKNGYREYDIGETPNNELSLAAFKLKWGAEPRMLYRYYYPQESAAEVDSSKHSLHKDLLGWCWRHVPLPVTSFLGTLIYSYL
jgi:hypothetical protein